ncbi:hypothetical protein TNCV_404941 [Trichonephila clavipes]|nr:hypothetical protein TNCV_404941 [Trichonephila clavipes]
MIYAPTLVLIVAFRVKYGYATFHGPACHEFEPRTAGNFPCRRGRYTLNLSRLKRPPVGVVQNLREGVSSSGVLLVT